MPLLPLDPLLPELPLVPFAPLLPLEPDEPLLPLVPLITTLLCMIPLESIVSAWPSVELMDNPLTIKGFESPEITILEFKKLNDPEKFPGFI